MPITIDGFDLCSIYFMTAYWPTSSVRVEPPDLCVETEGSWPHKRMQHAEAAEIEHQGPNILKRHFSGLLTISISTLLVPTRLTEDDHYEIT
jgi:hypothetical protein